MANIGHIKNVFPGGNTYKGFYSFYDYIISDDAVRKFVIKGGPGVGKSTFMKVIANEFVNLGYDVEMHHCSSDNNSLDGVVIKKAKIALLDGTAPHVVDPRNPGAVDEIINMGEFWNEDGIVKERDIIVGINKELKKIFSGVYHYLSSAKEMQDDIEAMIDEAVDIGKYNEMLLNLREKFTDNLVAVEEIGSTRHLFDSAITPDGQLDYIDSIITPDHNCYYLKGQHTLGSTAILDALAKEYTYRGYSVELYHQPLNPHRLQTLVVDGLDIAFTTNPKMESKSLKVFNLDDYLDQKLLAKRAEKIAKDREVCAMLIDEAVKRINEAKRLHDDMEKSYIPNMDFAGISELRNKIINRIKTLIK